MINKQRLNILYWVIWFGLVAMAAILNLQGLTGFVGETSPVAAFDELHSIKEVYNILTANDLKQFILSIIAGKGYIYGRLIYMCDALIAFIPFKTFGLDGLIFSVRMAHSLYLLLAFVLISKFISKSIYARIGSLVLFSVFPVLLYFMIMPKPEPMQLLLIGLFFTYYKKYHWSWLFLGLALGSKISIVFSCLLLFMWLLFIVKQKHITAQEALKKMGYGLMGLLIALPGLIFTPFNAQFRAGIIGIVGNASKPYDNPNIGFTDWTHKLFTYFYGLPWPISYLLVIVIFAATIYIVIKKSDKHLYVLFAALAILPIMIFTKRLWGHYLFLGMAMLLPFVFEAVFSLFKSRSSKIIAGILILVLFGFHLKPAIENFYANKNRNNNIAFFKAKEQTLAAIKYCQVKNPKVNVGIDIKLYYQYNWSLKTVPNAPIYCNKYEFKDLDLTFILLKTGDKYPNLSASHQLLNTIGEVSIYSIK